MAKVHEKLGKAPTRLLELGVSLGVAMVLVTIVCITVIRKRTSSPDYDHAAKNVGGAAIYGGGAAIYGGVSFTWE
eukprot:2740057-Rhodomonas_salina.1